MRTETAAVTTSDGLSLAADLTLPDGQVRGAAVVCHPHPLYGGDRHNPVVGALVEALVHSGVATVKFDFRGAGGSPGRHDDGRAELLDVAAALDTAIAAAQRARNAPATSAGLPVVDTERSIPVVLAGYSFGALMALAIVDERITAWLAVAPPLRPGGSLIGDAPLRAASDPRPKHLLVAAHDQFASPAVVHDATTDWKSVTIVELPSADHFLNGAHHLIRAETTAFAITLLPTA